jgi:Rrf2 family protein
VAQKDGRSLRRYTVMKLSTRSRYGTRLMVDMAEHYQEGPVHLGDIARRQNISVKYLEQIIIPLKKAHYIDSIRGPKGGHVLARPPAEITVAEIVALLEDGASLSECSAHADVCERADFCPTRLVWKAASEAMFDKLKSITLADLAAKAGDAKGKEMNNVL